MKHTKSILEINYLITENTMDGAGCKVLLDSFLNSRKYLDDTRFVGVVRLCDVVGPNRSVDDTMNAFRQRMLSYCCKSMPISDHDIQTMDVQSDVFVGRDEPSYATSIVVNLHLALTSIRYCDYKHMLDTVYNELESRGFFINIHVISNSPKSVVITDGEETPCLIGLRYVDGKKFNARFWVSDKTDHGETQRSLMSILHSAFGYQELNHIYNEGFSGYQYNRAVLYLIDTFVKDITDDMHGTNNHFYTKYFDTHGFDESATNWMNCMSEWIDSVAKKESHGLFPMRKLADVIDRSGGTMYRGELLTADSCKLKCGIALVDAMGTTDLYGDSKVVSA